VNGHTVWNVRRRTAFVSQDYQLGGGIARDILTRIAEFKANRGMSLEPEKVGAVCDALELAGRLLDKPIGDLSGGERQRLALLAALLLGREVFLLDEVTSALDPALKRKVVRLLLDQPGVTLITASHDEAWLDSGQVRTVKLEDRP
jgi:putative ABC transport system ATP-binding protein